MNAKRIVKVLVVIGIMFVLIQFIQPNRSNPQYDPAKTMQSELQMPAIIASLLERGCKDCHSNETHWPFYSYIAPASWLVSNDVTKGRRRFNMSEWGTYKVTRKIQKFTGINQVVSDHSMPLPMYISFHPKANLTDSERDTLAKWAQYQAEKLMSAEEKE